MAKDPYKYYRIEARELCETLGQGLMQIDKGGEKEITARLLRAAHTLKGAARVVKHPAVAELAHSFEEALGPHRDGDAPSRNKVGQLLGMVDAMGAQIASLDGSPAPAAAAPAAPPVPAEPAADPFATVRVEIAEMDGLLEGVTEAAVQLTALDREAGALAAARRLAGQLAAQLSGEGGRAGALADRLCAALDRVQRGLASGLRRAQAEVDQVRERADTLRLVPAASIFPTIERAVRDAGAELGKTVELTTSGGDCRLDGHVLRPLRDALLHVVRNAVAHGIESDVERAAARKPAAGRVELRVERRGNRLAFICGDDGRGIDLAAVRRAAVRAGRLTEGQAAALDLGGAVKLLLAGGVSTQTTVSEIAGRGIGLDAVRDLVAGLKGHVTVRSEPGRGATLELVVPLSLSSVRALIVTARGQRVCLPLDAVRRTLRIADSAIARSPAGDTVYDGQRVMPYAELGSLLGFPAGAAPPPSHRSVVIVESAHGPAALAVDALHGTSDVLVRPLPTVLGEVPACLGACFDADGDPQPVLDADGLAGELRARGAAGPAAPPPRPSRPRILVIDDSLTTRMLEQNILETAGYDVDTAVCGEDGLARAGERRYALFVCDVEMPGMDGFEFVSRTRADAQLRQTPAILMTSLGGEEHKRRGVEAGARAYVVKGQFDQGSFLDIIRRLAG